MASKADEIAQRKARSQLAGAILDQISTRKGPGCDGTEVVAIQARASGQGSDTTIILSTQAASELRRQLTELE